MTTQQRDEVESGVRAALQAGRHDEAATLVIRGYGGEVLGFLCATMQSEADASEVFAQLCEDLWRGLPAFRWGSSLRTWTYALARNASHRFRRDPYRRRGVAIGEVAWLDELEAAVRTDTLSYLRSEVREAVAQLRAQLDPDDQALIVLRVDRQMSWDEIARVFDETDAEPAARRRQAAALRKQFERAKERLRTLAREAGLLGNAG